MKVAEVAREAIYGKTITKSFNGLLDDKLESTAKVNEAIKQLHKISFSNPNLSTQVNTVIRILEGRG